MIQRIQTIWLLISAISSGSLISGRTINFISNTGQKYFTGFSGMYKLTDSGNEIITESVLLEALIFLIPILSLISIFLYKSRRVQKTITFIIIVLSLCLVTLEVYYSIFLMKNFDVELIPGVKMVLPAIILIAAILAFKGILKDDRIVKSYDRLR